MVRNILSKGIKYDLVFVIKGAKIEKTVFRVLTECNSKTQFVLYLWDEVARVPNFSNNKEYFDRIYSFSQVDAEQYGLFYLPLFYCDEYKRIGDSQKEIDIFFSGEEHSNRSKFIDKILPILKDSQMKIVIHLFVGRSRNIYKRLFIMDPGNKT